MRLIRFKTFLPIIGFFIIVFYYVISNSIRDSTPSPTLSNTNDYFKDLEDLKQRKMLINTSVCKIPDIGFWDPSIIRFIQKSSGFEYDCWERAQRRWSFVQGKEIHLNETEIKRSGFTLKSIDCVYKPIFRVNQNQENYNFYADRVIKYGDPVPFGSKSFLNPGHEYVKIICTLKDDLLNPLIESQPQIGRILYTQHHALPNVQIPSRKKEFWSKVKQKPPNIILIGLDSTSRSNFHRLMPKTNEIIKELRMFEMNGYTKVGENTFPNAMAFLTGYKEETIIPLCAIDTTVDKIDPCQFLWTLLDKYNYSTAFIEDAPAVANFNYLKVGFVDQPTDIYFRPFLIGTREGNPDGYPFTKGCLGHSNIHDLIYTYLFNMLKTTINELIIPLYAIAWLTNYSHVYQNELQFIDEAVADFFKSLEQEGILDNSLMFFMSDHGYRYGDFRKTFSGWYEDKLPYMFIHLPKSFKSHPKYSNWTESLQINADRLTSPFDVYQTTVHILEEFNPGFKLEEMKDVNGTALKRIYGQSLLKLVNENRTCSEAGIPSEFCACDFPVKIRNLEDPLLIQSAEISIREINRILEPLNKCETFTLGQILNGAKKEGWSNTEVEFSYSVIFSTKPGDFSFEATVDFFRFSDGRTPTPQLSSRVERMDKIDKTKTKCTSSSTEELYCYCS